MVTSIFSPISGKLTKAFLIAAPAGDYLTSNCGFPPIFAESVSSSMQARLDQWKRIVATHANGRLCYIYASRQQYEHEQKVFIDRLIREGGKLPNTVVM
jgi:hypothetical protein